MNWLALAVAVALLGGCDRGESEFARESLVVRIGAPFGLAELSPGPRQSGSSAMIIDLVFEPIARHVEVESVDGATLVLRILPGAPPVAELASTLRVDGLVEAVEVDEKRFRATMGSAEQAAGLASLEFGGFERGPFVADPWRPGDEIQRLRARDDRRVRAIELVSMPIQEQWRRLLARDIDVVPHNTMRQREYYEGLASVRMIDVPSDRSFALVFSVNKISDVNERRYIAGSIDRLAVARASGGTATLASRELLVQTSDLESFTPARSLRIGYLSSDQFAEDIARVVRLQLERAGYDVILASRTIEQLGRREEDAVLFPFPEGDLALHYLGTEGMPAYYGNAAVGDALDRGDLTAARAIVQHDMPIVPLVRNVAFAAVDATLCGGEPTDLGTWDWVADLYPCEDDR